MSFSMINSTKKDGNTSTKYDEANQAIKNRVSFFNRQGIPVEKTLKIKIKYSDEILELDKTFFMENKDLSTLELLTDCIITKQKDIFIWLPFADCIPLAIYDNKNKILAFAHMGWQSIELKLHDKIINKLVKEYGSNIKDLEVALGPSIKKESYRLENPSQLKHDDWKPYLKRIKDETYEIDLNGYLCNGLKELGIENITNSSIDTAVDENYFSHYRSKYISSSEEEGRFICGVITRE